MAATSVDWTLEEGSLRKELLKLTKSQLIKLCKSNHISTYDAKYKQNMVDELIKNNNTNPKSKTPTQMQSTKVKSKHKEHASNKQDPVRQINDTLNFEEINTIRDGKIIHGYIKSNFIKQYNDIPKDIIDLFFMFYHIVIREVFKHYNSDHYVLSKNDTTVTKKDYQCCMCYDSACISSLDVGIYLWRFQIIKLSDTNINHSMAIGIDETRYIRKNNGSFWDYNGRSKCYALWHTAVKSHGDYYGMFDRENNSLTFKTNDIVCMTLDLLHRTLSYQINEEETHIVFTDIAVNNDIEYCLGVYIAGSGDCIELLECVRL